MAQFTCNLQFSTFRNNEAFNLHELEDRFFDIQKAIRVSQFAVCLNSLLDFEEMNVVATELHLLFYSYLYVINNIHSENETTNLFFSIVNQSFT